MYIDIYVCRIYLEIKEVRNLLALGNEMGKGLKHCLVKIRMAHITAIYEEVLISILLTCCLRFTHKTLDAG